MDLVANQKKSLNFVPKKGVSIVLFKKKKPRLKQVSLVIHLCLLHITKIPCIQGSHNSKTTLTNVNWVVFSPL